MDSRDCSKMIYRHLGNSGLEVSVLSFGTWYTAEKDDADRDIIDCVKKAFAHGVNFFDTAEIYSFGKAEEVLGKAIKELNCDREDLVIATKLWQGGHGPNDKMLSRKHLLEGMKKSLECLQLDYVDIIFCHRPDFETPLEETCRAMDWIIEEGYAFYWATSEWSADRVNEAMEICNRLHLHKPIADQCQYHMLCRDNLERNLRECYEEYGYGTTIWSPLAGGILSGKYNDGNVPTGSRFDGSKFMDGIFQNYLGEKTKEKTIKLLQGLGEIAAEVGCTQAQLVLAWTIVNKDVTSCIFGSTRVSQVEDNLKALEIAAKWTKELEEKIEVVLGNAPDMQYDFSRFTKFEARRSERIDYNMIPEEESAFAKIVFNEFNKHNTA